MVLNMILKLLEVIWIYNNTSNKNLFIKFNKIMQLADPEQLLECLSAQELLSALKQLKKINPMPNE